MHCPCLRSARWRLQIVMLPVAKLSVGQITMAMVRRLMSLRAGLRIIIHVPKAKSWLQKMRQ